MVCTVRIPLITNLQPTPTYCSLPSIVTTKDGCTVRYAGTVRYASIFAKKYGTLIQHVFFGMVRERYVGTLYELKIPDFSHIAPAFCTQGQKTAETDAKCVN